MNRQTVNIKQAMILTGRCRRTIEYWIKKNRIESYRIKNENEPPMTRIYIDSLPEKKS